MASTLNKVGNLDYPIKWGDYMIIEWVIPNLSTKYRGIVGKPG